MTSKKIITHCAPTLAGIKTASLFNEQYSNEEELLDEITCFNKDFKDRGLNMIPLSFKNNTALIYVYRIKDLENDFQNCLSKELLKKYGYDTDDIFTAINRLSNRMKDYVNFPHEIGLFLGYPPEDVKGFIDNDAKNYKYIGYWKVYGDVDKSKKEFEKYHSCQKILLDRLNRGYSLKDLVIQK